LLVRRLLTVLTAAATDTAALVLRTVAATALAVLLVLRLLAVTAAASTALLVPAVALTRLPALAALSALTATTALLATGGLLGGELHGEPLGQGHLSLAARRGRAEVDLLLDGRA